MNYINKTMLPGEQVVYYTRKHYIIFLQPTLWTVGMLYLLYLSQTNAFLYYPTLVFGIIAFFSWMNGLLNYFFSEFTITNKRVIMREGFFVRHLTETRIATISNVNINQNPFGLMLNYGVVILKTYSGDDDPFTDIPKPFAFKRQLQIQLDNQSMPGAG